MVAEATSMAVAIGNEEGKVLFATARAQRLLGAQMIPPTVLALAETNKPLTHDESAKVTLPGTVHAVHVRAQRLPGSPRHILVFLVEEAPRSSLSKSLVSRFGLNARAVQLVQLTSRGMTNREIAERLRLSESTVKTYMHGLFRDVGVRNRAELVALAERMAV